MNFKAAATKVHGTKYRYHKAVYTRAHEKVEVVCPAHGSFMVSPANHIHKKSGCPTCKGANSSANLRMTQEQFLRRAKAKHGDRYDYTKTKYCGQNGNVTIRCIKCDHTFRQEGGSHLAGRGCPICARIAIGNALRKSTAELNHKLKTVHGSNIVVDFSEYKSIRTPIKVTCRKCEAQFQTTTIALLKGSGCRACSGAGFSNMALAWLAHEAKTRRIKIQHALNGGEFKIPGTNYRVDGYNKRSNTVFEFHGDRFHGNPKRFKSTDKPNPYSDKTAKELYSVTRKREKLLRSLGYNVVVMWESDWRALMA